jgi:hypothetical protein
MHVGSAMRIATIMLLFASNQVLGQTIQEVDVCVYGGTSAGVIAAYTAQKQGKTAILIEPGKHLGGMTAGGLGYTDIGNKYAITGLARDFYRRVGQHYGKFEQWIFEPKVASAIFNDYVTRGGYQVLFDTRLRSVTKVGTKITEILLENSINPAGSTTTIKAKMFIDCSYEGDLMAKAGVSFIVGRESNSVYAETYNGVQLKTNHNFPDGIDPYVVPGQPSSGLLWGISNGTLAPTGSGDTKVQAYNYRICLTSDPAKRIPITEPEEYDPSRYELLLRQMATAPTKTALYNFFIWSGMPNRKTDINNRNGFSTDMIGMNHDYPNGTYDQRKQIIHNHEVYTKGLLYFIGHDPRVPLQTRNEMLNWGYPMDEYVDNGNWSPQLYIREARRMIGNYVMTQKNCLGQLTATDGVGLAAYTMDSHHTQRIVVNGMVKNEGCIEVGGFGPYPIAYNALIPKPAECSNILVPVCLSASHIAYGSIRMEPVFMVLAQSAATAAVMAINANTDVQNVNIPLLQERLKDDPLADGSLFEILVDNADTTNVQTTGTWTPATAGGYGPNYLVNPGTGSTVETVRFTPVIPNEGTYKAYIYFPKVTGISTQTVIKVFDGRNTIREIIVKEADIRVTGQTSGEWVELGTYDVPQGKHTYVEVTTRDADGKIIADAVIWVPVASVDPLRNPENPANTENGLSYAYYEGTWDTLPDFNSLTPVKTGPIATVNLYPKRREDDYAFKWTGYIDVPADAVYSFFTRSDEGSQLFIGSTLVVNNDGLHTEQEAGGQIGLKKGKHAITVTFFERLGTARIIVIYAGGGIAKNVIPNQAFYRVSTNTPPVGQIITPAPGALYRGGEVINFSGDATDTESGTLPASAFAWSVDFHHDTTVQPGPAVASGVKSGSFTIPADGETSDSVWYRLTLTVTDPQGLQHATYRDILPRKSIINLATQPAGLQTTLDGQTITTPFSTVSVEGIQRTIGVVSPQISGGQTYHFDHWQHGGTAAQTIATPIDDATYTAVYVPALREPENPSNTENGLTYYYYEGVWSALPDFNSLIPVKTGPIVNVNLWPKRRDDDYAFKWTGYIDVPEDAVYSFFTRSDEGSQLFIGSTLVVNNDGLHTEQEAGGQIGLKRGKHAITVTFFERLGTARIIVIYAGGGIAKNVIPNQAFFRLAPAAAASARAIAGEEEEARPANGFAVYPNPAFREINVDVTAAEGETIEITLVNLYGQIVKTGTLKTYPYNTGTILLAIDDLPSGIYHVRLREGNTCRTSRVVVAK